ncbi:MAG: hypothetical protein K6B28_04155, partial [Lachnospiraceae bacterium]|nr:hypothetical protein [Lachnospiraceae bacterium]
MKSRLLIIFAFTSFLILVSLLSVAYLSKNKGQGSVAYTENTSNEMMGSPEALEGSGSQASTEMTGSPEALEGSGSHASNEASDKVSNETSDKASDKEGSAYLNSLTDSAPDTSPDSVKNSGDQTDDQTASEEGSEGLKEQAKEREPLPKYKDILEINPYVSGWLTIDGLTDEPVIYTPKSQNYFLHRLYDGTEAERGSLFIALNWQ